MKVSQFLKEIRNVSKDDLLKVDGIGEVLADNYKTFLESDRLKEMIGDFKEMESKGLEMNVVNTLDSSTKELINQKICITGSFNISRNQIIKILESKGARIVSSVTKNTTLLLSGSKSGSKFAKATELEIPILTDYTHL